jgi:hypothetical protein
MVDVLLSRGANVHLKTPFGCTALHAAANRWCSDVFRRFATSPVMDVLNK